MKNSAIFFILAKIDVIAIVYLAMIKIFIALVDPSISETR